MPQKTLIFCSACFQHFVYGIIAWYLMCVCRCVCVFFMSAWEKDFVWIIYHIFLSLFPPSLFPPSIFCFLLLMNLESTRWPGTILGARDTVVNISGKIPLIICFIIWFIYKILNLVFSKQCAKMLLHRVSWECVCWYQRLIGEFAESFLEEVRSLLRSEGCKVAVRQEKKSSAVPGRRRSWCKDLGNRERDVFEEVKKFSVSRVLVAQEPSQDMKSARAF